MTNIQLPTIPRSQIVFGHLVYWVTILAAIICIVGPLVAFIEVNSNVINPHYEMSNIFYGMKSDFKLQTLQANAAAGTNFLTVEDTAKFDDPDKFGRDVNIRITSKDGRGELAVVAALNSDTDTLELSKPLINSYDAQQTEVGEVTVWNNRGSYSLISNVQAGSEALTIANVDRIDSPTAERPIALLVEDDNNREQVFVDTINRKDNTILLKEPLTHSYSVSNSAKVTQITAAKDVEGHFWIHNLTNGDGLTQFGLVIGCAVGIPAMGGAAIVLAFKEKSFGWALGALLIALMILGAALGLV
jgi:hypothetical protein